MLGGGVPTPSMDRIKKRTALHELPLHSQWTPNLCRNTSAIHPFEGNPGWNLATAMAEQAIQHTELKEIAPDKPSPRLLRTRRHALAASSDAGVDQKNKRHASLRRGVKQSARNHLRQLTAAGHLAGEHEANTLAEGTAGMGNAQQGGEEAVHQASRRLRGVPRIHRRSL
jgi:hypothetical protein